MSLRRRGLIENMSIREPQLKKLGSVSCTDQNAAMKWYLTEEASACHEFYVYINLTTTESVAINLCINGGTAQSSYASFSANTSFDSASVIAYTKDAIVNNKSISRRILGTSKNSYGTLSYIAVRPASGTAKMTGTMEVWGWV